MAKSRGWIILAVLAAIIGLIGIGSIALTAANAAGVSGTPTPTTTTTTNPGQGPGKGHGKGHGPKATLSVTNVSGQKITAKRQDGTTITITTTSSTIYRRAGQSASASVVTTGTTIHVRGTTNSDGSITATQIDIVLPSYHGTVTSVNGSSFTVQDRSGASRTINISSSTTFVRAGQTVSLSAITKGENVGAEGSLNSDGSLNAQDVHIDLPHVGGQITKISGSTITTQDRRGTHTIQLSSSTTYINDQTQQKIALSSLKVGDNIHAEGTLNSNGSVSALVVHLSPAKPAGTNGTPTPKGTQTAS